MYFYYYDTIYCNAFGPSLFKFFISCECLRYGMKNISTYYFFFLLLLNNLSSIIRKSLILLVQEQAYYQ